MFRDAILAILLLVGFPTASVSMEFESELEDLRPLMEPVILIKMKGPIVSADPARLRAVLAQYDNVSVRDISVSLDSPGGNLMAGIEMGRILHERPEIVSTTVTNDLNAVPSCASACVFTYLGGDYRYLPENSLLGVHRFSSSDEELGASAALATAQSISAVIVSFILEMRADQKLFDKMSAMPAEGIDWLSREDLARWNVVTGSVFEEREEYLNLNGGLALQLSHTSLHGDSNIVVMCGGKGPVGVTSLREPPVTAIGSFAIVIDGKVFKLNDWDVVSREDGRTLVAFNFPSELRSIVANSRSFGARIIVPSGDLFYGFEQTIRSSKLFDTIQGCGTRNTPKPPLKKFRSVGGMSVFPDKDITGNDLTKKGFRGVSFEECQSICLEYEYCMAVSYVVSKKWCWPKAGVTGTKSSTDVVSAAR